MVVSYKCCRNSDGSFRVACGFNILIDSPSLIKLEFIYCVSFGWILASTPGLRIDEYKSVLIMLPVFLKSPSILYAIDGSRLISFSSGLNIIPASSLIISLGVLSKYTLSFISWMLKLKIEL